MSIVQSDKSSKAIIRVETSADKYENRMINNVNPDLTDEEFYNYFSNSAVAGGNISYGLAYYQVYPFNGLLRTNQYLLSKE